MEKVKFTTNLDKELLAAIKAQAKKEGRGVNALLEQCMEIYLKHANLMYV